MPTVDDHLSMIQAVAIAMGPELLKEVAFVGGCTTALMLTDLYTKQQVRHTDDVDLIVHVMSRGHWTSLIEHLRARGFKEDMTQDAPICAMFLNSLRVDFMPDDDSILEFGNRWYREALEHAEPRDVGGGIEVRIVRPDHFLATKLAAYLSRGGNDPIGSHDIEDILTVLDGRPEITDEMLRASRELRVYVGAQLDALSRHRDFDYAVAAASNDDAAREAGIHDRIQLITSFGALE
jgi:predicted nucleotidyltransferase